MMPDTLQPHNVDGRSLVEQRVRRTMDLVDVDACSFKIAFGDEFVAQLLLADFSDDLLLEPQVEDLIDEFSGLVFR